jgi:hypothetical protein
MAGPVAAQVTTGTIHGQVLDQSGLPIVSALVRASDATHGVARTAATDGTGMYRIVDLAPGDYALAVTAAGFEEVSEHDVPVLVNTTVRVNFRLMVAGVSQIVDVTAADRLAGSDSSDLAAILDEQRISSLPLNRRDFLQLALLAGGVLPPVEDSELSTRGGFAMHANGGREDFNNFLLDGVDNNDPYVNRYAVQPPVDHIQEFKVATNGYSAEYGRSAAGQVNVITRRGGDRTQGVAYEYLRNRSLDARNFFDGGDRAPFVRNQFGGGVGGPLPGTSTFFFAGVDVLRERRGLSRLATVPTAAERAGDLSALEGTIVDPFTRRPFPGNLIPAERVSPTALRILDLFPMPNRSGPGGNYLGRPVQREDVTQGNVRLDHALTSSDQLTFRYSESRAELFEPYAEDAGALPGFGDFLDDRARNAMIQHQRIVGARLVNSLRLGFNRFSRDLLNENQETDAGTLWGVSWLPSDPRSFGFPTLNVAGYSRVGDVTSLPIVRHTDTWHLAEALSWDRGRHLVKLGGEVRHVRLDGTLDLLTRGSLSFSGALSGSGISDLLLGLPSFGLRADAGNVLTLRSTAAGAYLQDEWSPFSKLTLNLGMRYDYVTPPVDPTDRMSAFDGQIGQIVRVGAGSVPRSGVRPDRDNVAPRVGVSWNPTANVTVRGGYGLYYDAGNLTVNTAQSFNPPWFTLRVFFPSPAGLLTLADPFPNRGGVAPPPALNVLSPDLVTSSLQHWNIAADRRIGDFGTVSVAYAGSRGAHLVRARDLNQPRPAPGDVQSRRPYPEYGSIFFVESAGTSSFNSMQVSFNRPLRRGVSVWAVYTLSKSTDDASAFLDTRGDRNFPQDSANVRAERAPSSFDVRHRLVMAYSIELPQTNVWTRDTQVRGIVTVQSGQPFTPLLRFDNSNTGNGGTAGWDRPDLVGDPHLPHPTADRWFDTSAFAVPARYSFGDAGRNSLRGPGFASFDLSIARRIGFSASRALLIEAQAFNLLNRTNFDLPEPFADEPATFGRIFSARAPRQIQLVARFEF